MIEKISGPDYHRAITDLRHFFLNQGFIEVQTQANLSILAACEDPTTVATFNYAGQVWPLPQTGQMKLEEYLLRDKLEKVFCISTSYRQEPDPIPGRHSLIFPMFEFESLGNMEDLIHLLKKLLAHLNFKEQTIQTLSYEEIAKLFAIKTIGAKEEERINLEISSVVLLTDFPEHTSPFWNMKRNRITDTANKVDTILYGVETIGSAEREVDTQVMEERFHSISDGLYADLLYSHFGKHRVLKELHEFLSLEMVPRFGGGCGITRFIRAMKQNEINLSN